MGNPQETDLFELGWLSGIIDGEGSFCFKSTRTPQGYECFRPCFFLANTDKSIIDRFGRILSQLGLPFNIRLHGQRKSRNKPAYQLSVEGLKRVKRMLEVLDGRIGSKKRAADVLHEYITMRLQKPNHAPTGPEEYAIVAKSRAVNQRGNQTGSSTTTRVARETVMI